MRVMISVIRAAMMRVMRLVMIVGSDVGNKFGNGSVII